MQLLFTMGYNLPADAFQNLMHPKQESSAMVCNKSSCTIFTHEQVELALKTTNINNNFGR